MYALSGLLNGLLSSVLGLLIYARAPTHPAHRTYGRYCFSLALWGYGYCLWQLAESEDRARLFAHVLMFGAILIPVTHLHDVQTLLGYHDRRQRRLRYIAWICGGVFFTANFSTLIVAGIAPQGAFPFWPQPGSLFLPYLIYFALCVGYASYLYLDRFRRAAPSQGVQYLCLFLFSAIGYAGGATNFPLWYGIDIAPNGTILVSLYVATAAYVLVRYRMLDFSHTVERAVTFVLLAIAVSLPLLGGVLFIQQRYLGYIEMPVTALVLAYATFMVGAVYWLREHWHGFIERTLFRKRYDLYDALSTFSKTLITNLDLHTFGRELVHQLAAIMNIQRVSLYVLEPEKDGFSVVAQYGSAQNPRECPRPRTTDALPLYLERHGMPLVGERLDDERHDAVKTAVRGALQRMTIHVALPLLSQGRLIGWCALGPRHRAQGYSARDLHLLDSVAREASIALENALLYEELKRSKALAERSVRLRSLETMAGGLAHEIRNPLTSIKAFVDLAPERLSDHGFLQRFGQVVKDDVSRIERLTQDVLSYAQPTQPHLKPEDLNTIVESCLSGVRLRPAHQHIIINKDLATSLPMIRADHQHIAQILLNLCVNALESMTGKGGMLTVRSGVRHDASGQQWVHVEIQDTGQGISAEDLEHIFDPFFTTKHHRADRGYTGTGLGLAIAHQLVEEHHGRIEVESDVGVGTTFIVKFPAHDPERELYAPHSMTDHVS